MNTPGDNGRRRATLGLLLLVLALPTFGRGQDALFVRGNANGDLELNISDAVTTLGFLFLGTPRRLPCDDAADAADDGVLDLTDAVAILNFLFLGSTRSLPPPFTACGADPTADALGCATFPPCE